MAWVPGGDFWVGSSQEERFSADESPRFLTRVAAFCLDLTEVTVASYAACAASGACRPAGKDRKLCNAERASLRDHPVNCVSHGDAEAFCAARGARLPTEVEWEFAARGGSSTQRYPWGNESPDGRVCWKQPGTCPVRRFAAGAFGLYDLSGNVWEWTESWYGPYPFPPETAHAKVYRGGSFSRRFEKWMHTRLRNRAAPRIPVRTSDFAARRPRRASVVPSARMPGAAVIMACSIGRARAAKRGTACAAPPRGRRAAGPDVWRSRATAACSRSPPRTPRGTSPPRCAKCSEREARSTMRTALRTNVTARSLSAMQAAATRHVIS